MSALPWIIGGAAVGVGFLWWRERAAAKSTTPNADPCKALAAAGVPEDACRFAFPLVSGLVQGVVDAVDDLAKTPGDVAEWDRRNKELNGEVEIANERFYKALTRTCISQSSGGSAPGAMNCFPALDGTVVKFKNGCVPAAGPDFAKCAPGTRDMLAYPILQAFHWSADGKQGESFQPRATSAMSGRTIPVGVDNGVYDPFTRGGFTGPVYGNEFPLPIPPGHLGFVIKGEPVVCPAGQAPAIVRDHRTGEDVVSATCSVPPPPGADSPSDGSSVDWRGLGGFGALSSAEIDCNTDPRYVWDPAGFCRRRRVGE